MTEETLPQKLRVKADMITLCERIQWGSETSLMREAADQIEWLEAQLNVAIEQRDSATNLNNRMAEELSKYHNLEAGLNLAYQSGCTMTLFEVYENYIEGNQ